MGKINNDTEKLGKVKESQPRTKKQCLETSSDRGIVKCVIAFMVTGIFSNMQYAFRNFASKLFDSDQIFETIWILESILLYARAGGLSPSRRIYKTIIFLTSEK